jgi:hypothetical protein
MVTAERERRTVRVQAAVAEPRRGSRPRQPPGPGRLSRGHRLNYFLRNIPLALRLGGGHQRELARAGLGCRAIAARYYEKFSEPVSPATIARRLRAVGL